MVRGDSQVEPEGHTVPGAKAAGPAGARPAPAGSGVLDSVLDIRGLGGLDEAEALRRLQAEGPNELAARRERTLFAIVLEVVREPMFLMLVICGLLYMVMGELTCYRNPRSRFQVRVLTPAERQRGPFVSEVQLSFLRRNAHAGPVTARCGRRILVREST